MRGGYDLVSFIRKIFKPFIDFNSKYEALMERYNEQKYSAVISGVIFSFFPVVCFYLMEFYEHNPFVDVRSMAQVFNIILFELIAWFFYVLTGRAKVAIRILIVLSTVFGLINHYVTLFRSTPFVPWDVFSIKTAGSVASNYEFVLSKSVLVVTGIFLAIYILMYFMDFRMKMSIKFRWVPAVLVGIAFCSFVNILQDDDFQTDNYLYPFLFTPAYMTKVNGMAVTFAMDMEYVAIDKPSGYKREECKEILEDYEEDKNSKDLPNIIVVMDEAFSDLRVLGEFKTEVDYMPFMHSLQNGAPNTITGNLNVSVCGGNTANTEFEFLTGNTMAFLPNGSIPYQQYIKDESPSMASYLKGLGYATYAQHPYYSSGWDRDTVYPKLGFDHTTFLYDYSRVSYIRDYASDESSFNQIIETFENKEEGKPAFIFNVTMQNHGGYNDYYPDLETVENEYNNSALNQYLSLVKITDEQLENLIAYFKNVDEKTVIVFFGDHQPNDAVASSVLAANGMNYRDLSTEELQLRYKVPYLVWANYDIGSMTDYETSVNYLGAEVLKSAGVPTSDYQNFLLDLKKDYPIISAVKEDVNTDLQKMEEEDKSDSKNKSAEEKLKIYKKLQYYRLFDWKED